MGKIGREDDCMHTNVPAMGEENAEHENDDQRASPNPSVGCVWSNLVEKRLVPLQAHGARSSVTGAKPRRREGNEWETRLPNGDTGNGRARENRAGRSTWAIREVWAATT